MVGITSVNQSQIDQFIEDTGITFPILQDESSNSGNGPSGFGGVTYDNYYIPNQGSPYPRDFIVDQDGILVYANNEIDTEYMINILHMLLEEEDIVSTNNQNYFPSGLTIFPAFPNPFNPIINIPFYVDDQIEIEIIIYNNLGKVVAEVLNNKLTVGQRQVHWNATAYPSGIYFIRFSSDFSQNVQKVVLIK